jgi:hypothetical protein
MTTSKKIVTLDLNDFVKAHAWQDSPGLWSRETGLEVSKKFEVIKMTDPNTMIVLKVVNGARMDDSFLKALLGPLARKVGPKALGKRVKVEGGHPGGHHRYYEKVSTAQQVKDYLVEEAERIAKRDAKKAKEANPEWSEPSRFFVPDIGTRVRLVEDWTFRLYAESRNYDFFKKMKFKYSQQNWRYDNPMEEVDVTINAGSILKVNRIYIRQGVSAYSSLTFNLQKGAVVNGNADVFKKGGIRFWAKLSDVNKARVEVDIASLAEN